jgi:hypothetical protein
MPSPSDKEVEILSPNPRMSPSEILWDVQTGKRDTKAFGEAMFIGMPAVTQWIHIQKLSPQNKGALPHIPLQAGYRNEEQSLTHIWLLIISVATSFTVLM